MYIKICLEECFMKHNRKIFIAALALVLTVIIVLAACKRPGGDEVIVVTDKNGVPITDESGEAITVVVETEIVEITNDNGDKVYDENGEVKTSVVYHAQNVLVPVTDKNGNYVTNKDGKIESKLITVPPKYERLTSVQYFTDPLGSTLVDGNGDPITSVKDYTTQNAGQGGNSSNWGTTMGGSENDIFNAVAATPDGGVIAVFQTNSKDGTVKGLAKDSASVPYIMVMKYDANGKLKWQKVVTSDGALNIKAVDVDKNGNIAVAGFTNATNLGFKNYGDYDAIVYKLNSSGDVQWVQNFGGTMTDGFEAVSFAPDGGIVAAGICASNDGNAASLKLEKGKSAALVVKYDANGKLVFAQKVGSTGDSFKNVAVAPDNTVYAVGPFSSGTAAPKYGRADAAVARLAADGKVAWVKTYGGSKIENFSGLVATSDGCVIAGRSSSADNSLKDLGNQGDYDAIVVKYASDGNMVWNNAFRGPNADAFTSIKQLGDGTYVACGYSASATRDLKTVGNKGGKDGIIVTLSSIGQVTSVQGYGGTDDDEFTDICVLSSGEFVACGSTLSTNGDLVGARAQSDGTHTVGMIAKFK